MEKLPRNEYPRPQLVREQWMNLNGKWEFTVDDALNGKYLGYNEAKRFDREIIVPFCPESSLSGIGEVRFFNCVWYRREITIPSSWSKKRVILHFGAVDYEATVYVNGKYAVSHRGGYTPFSADITDLLEKEGNYITVCAQDDCRSGNQPVGKQSQDYYSQGCSYTRTTGIWQTVWMEPVEKEHIADVKIYSRRGYKGHRILRGKKCGKLRSCGLRYEQ